MTPNLRKKAWVEALLTKRPAIEQALGVPLGKIAGLVQEEVWGEKGFTEIKSINRLTPDIPYGGRKKKVWAIVREGVEPVFTNEQGRLRFTKYSIQVLLAFTFIS